MENSISQALAGFTAGAVSTLLLHPLDLIKTRFQVTEGATNSMLRTAKDIIRNEGIMALYRGISPNFTGSTCSWGLYFMFYQEIKNKFRENSVLKLSPGEHLAASAIAGAITCLFTNPIWVVKTRMVTQLSSDKMRYRGLFDGISNIAKYEGMRGLYKGLVPALFGVSHGAVQFMVYEELKYLRIQSHGDMERISTVEYMAMAMISKTLATISTYPYQVVKSRIQMKSEYTKENYTGVVKTIRFISKNEGIGGFYKGMGVNIFRVLPGTCITFAVYEAMSKLLRN